MSVQEKRSEILTALKREGITDLDGLADYLAKKADAKDAQGNPVILTAIVSPGFFVSH